MSSNTPSTSAEPIRVANLRTDILAAIPYKRGHEKAARQELEAMALNQLLAIYLNWAHRFIPRHKRRVQYVPDFWKSTIAQSLGGNILELAEHIERGDDLTVFLSHLVHSRGHVPAQVRAALPAKEKRWQDKDFALSALGIHHLHISSPRTPSGTVPHGDEIIFIEFTSEVATFIRAGTHHDFASQRFSEELFRSVGRMRADQGFAIEGVRLPQGSRSSTELSTLAAMGYTSLTAIDGKVVPFSFMATDGTPSFQSLHTNRVIRALADIDPKIEDANWVRALFDGAKLPVPVSPDFEWVLHGTALHLLERSSGVYFGAVPSYR
jgi:hypothetical protein